MAKPRDKAPAIELSSAFHKKAEQELERLRETVSRGLRDEMISLLEDELHSDLLITNGVSMVRAHKCIVQARCRHLWQEAWLTQISDPEDDGEISCLEMPALSKGKLVQFVRHLYSVSDPLLLLDEYMKYLPGGACCTSLVGPEPDNIRLPDMLQPETRGNSAPVMLSGDVPTKLEEEGASGGSEVTGIKGSVRKVGGSDLCLVEHGSGDIKIGGLDLCLKEHGSRVGKVGGSNLCQVEHGSGDMQVGGSDLCLVHNVFEDDHKNDVENIVECQRFHEENSTAITETQMGAVDCTKQVERPGDGVCQIQKDYQTSLDTTTRSEGGFENFQSSFHGEAEKPAGVGNEILGEKCVNKSTSGVSHQILDEPSVDKSTSGVGHQILGEAGVDKSTSGVGHQILGEESVDKSMAGVGHQILGEESVDKSTSGMGHQILGEESVDKSMLGVGHQVLGEASVDKSMSGVGHQILGEESVDKSMSGVGHQILGEESVDKSTSDGESLNPDFNLRFHRENMFHVPNIKQRAEDYTKYVRMSADVTGHNLDETSKEKLASEERTENPNIKSSCRIVQTDIQVDCLLNSLSTEFVSKEDREVRDLLELSLETAAGPCCQSQGTLTESCIQKELPSSELVDVGRDQEKVSQETTVRSSCQSQGTSAESWSQEELSSSKHATVITDWTGDRNMTGHLQTFSPKLVERNILTNINGKPGRCLGPDKACGGPTTLDTTSRIYTTCSPLGTDLLNMYLLEQDCDCCLSVEGVHFMAHKCVLSARSEYFLAMFGGQWSESKMAAVNLEAVSSQAVRQLLLFLYGGVLDLPAGSNMKELFVIADMYGVLTFTTVLVFYIKKDLCHFFHKPCPLCVSSTSEALILCHTFHLEELQTRCLKWMSRYFTKIWPTKSFSALDDTLHQMCFESMLSQMTASNVLDIIMECTKLISSLPRIKWTETVLYLITRLMDSAIEYTSSHFVDVLKTNEFLQWAKVASWNASSLEDIFYSVIDSLPVDTAGLVFQTLIKLRDLHSNPDNPEPEIAGLLEAMNKRCEMFIRTHIHHVTRSKQWSGLPQLIQARILETSAYVYLPDLAGNINSKPNLSSSGKNRRFTSDRSLSVGSSGLRAASRTAPAKANGSMPIKAPGKPDRQTGKSKSETRLSKSLPAPHLSGSKKSGVSGKGTEIAKRVASRERMRTTSYSQASSASEGSSQVVSSHSPAGEGSSKDATSHSPEIKSTRNGEDDREVPLDVRNSGGPPCSKSLISDTEFRAQSDTETCKVGLDEGSVREIDIHGGSPKFQGYRNSPLSEGLPQSETLKSLPQSDVYEGSPQSEGLGRSPPSDTACRSTLSSKSRSDSVAKELVPVESNGQLNSTEAIIRKEKLSPTKHLTSKLPTLIRTTRPTARLRPISMIGDGDISPGWRTNLTRPASVGSVVPVSDDSVVPVPASDGSAKPVSVGSARPVSVDASKSTSDGSAKPVSVGSARPSSIGSARPVSVDASKSTSDDSAKPVSVGSARPSSIGSARPVSVDASKSTSDDSAKPVSVGSARPSSIGSVRSLLPQPRKDHSVAHAVGNVSSGVLQGMSVDISPGHPGSFDGQEPSSAASETLTNVSLEHGGSGNLENFFSLPLYPLTDNAHSQTCLDECGNSVKSSLDLISAGTFGSRDNNSNTADTSLTCRVNTGGHKQVLATDTQPQVKVVHMSRTLNVGFLVPPD